MESLVTTSDSTFILEGFADFILETAALQILVESFVGCNHFTHIRSPLLFKNPGTHLPRLRNLSA